MSSRSRPSFSGHQPTPRPRIRRGTSNRFGFTILSACVLSGVAVGQHSSANPILTPRQSMPELAGAQTVLVDVTASINDGSADPSRLRAIVTRRFREIGFAVATDADQNHDVAVQIACREAEPAARLPGKTGEDGVRMGERSFMGPPCLLKYAYRGKSMPWKRVDRIVFSLGVEASRRAEKKGSGVAPMDTFARYLEEYDYPLLLTAEWEQTVRLRALLENARTDLERKRTIIFLLGEVRAEEAVNCLLIALEDDALVEPAALALGNFGRQVREPLVRLLRNAQRPEVQAAAARSLGNIGASTGDWSLSPLFVEILERPGLDIAVQIELVWALGKNPDRRSLPALERLYNRVWSVKSDDPQLDELRKAVDWSHRGVRLGGHTDEY